MTTSINSVTPKKRGRPATGKDPHVTFRCPEALVEQVDAFAAENALPRSKAIRRLIEKGLEKE